MSCCSGNELTLPESDFKTFATKVARGSRPSLSSRDACSDVMMPARMSDAKSTSNTSPSSAGPQNWMYWTRCWSVRQWRRQNRPNSEAEQGSCGGLGPLGFPVVKGEGFLYRVGTAPRSLNSMQVLLGLKHGAMLALLT